MGTRHTRLGWGASTIRAMLHNSRYVGVWRFKEKQWVKVPGTNKRVAKQRDASEVITLDRPDLRIIDPQTWQDTRARLTAIRNRYTGGPATRGAVRHRNTYLFSGVLICDQCKGPMTIMGGSSCRYYSCATNRTKGTCTNKRAIKEPIARERILGAIRERLTSEDGVAHVRKLVAEYLRDYSKNLDSEIRDRKERIKRTEDKIRALIDFVAQGIGRSTSRRRSRTWRRTSSRRRRPSPSSSRTPRSRSSCPASTRSSPWRFSWTSGSCRIPRPAASS